MAKRPGLAKEQKAENEKRIAALRRHWKLGKKIADRIAGTELSGRGAIFVALGKETTKSRSVLDQSRIFFQRYPTEEAFQELCRQCQTGHSLTTKHVFILNAVHDEKKRKKLLQASIRKGWSTNALRHQVDTQLRYKRYESIERRKPQSLEDALLQLADVARQWVLWSKRLESSGLGKELHAALPKGLRKGIASVLKQCEAVGDFEQDRIQARESKKGASSSG